MSIAPGTWVKFTADARLRSFNKDGQRDQRGMHEGVLIGEQDHAVVTQALGIDAYAVLFPEKNFVGWVYNHECYVEDPRKPLEKLNFVKVK
jgi:hypothetical protein